MVAESKDIQRVQMKIRNGAKEEVRKIPAGTAMVRPSVLNLDPYIPGKPIAELKREIPKLKNVRIIKLASNENPIGPSPKALSAIRKAEGEIHRYPEPTSPLLREALAKKFRVSPDQILVGSGVDEVLRVFVETVVEPGDVCVASRYAFSRFRQHAKLMGARVVETPMKKFRHDLALMAQEAVSRKAKAVFVANPNNPTSTFNTDQEVRALFKELGKAGPWVVLDEAYAEFASDAHPNFYPKSIPDYFELYPNLLVLRTLSKIMGLAGLRVGFCVGPADFIRHMNRVRLIFNVNSLGQAAAVGALGDQEHIAKTLAAVHSGRVYLARELKALGFEVVEPGAANFVFARVPRGTGLDLYLNLLDSGVIIRPMTEAGLEGYVRITIGLARENRVLIRILKKSFHRHQ